MNYYIFFTTDNKSGWKCRPDRLNNKHPEIYDKIISYIKKYPELTDLQFKQQIYHFINDLQFKPSCNECGSDKIKFLDIKRGYQQFCSIKCSNKNKDKQEKTKHTNLERFGVINPMLNPEIKKSIEKKNLKNFDNINPFGSEKIKEKIRKTNFEKYGNEVASKSKIVKENYKKTCLDKYGVETHWFNLEFREKIKNKIINKYGVDNVFKNSNIKEKIKNTNIENLGVDNPSKSTEIYKKIKKTNLEKYGNECILNLKRVKDKIKKTNLEKYGNECIFLSKNFRKKYLNKTSKIEKEICKQLNGKKFNYYDKEFDIIKGNNIYEIDGDFYHPNKLENLSILQVGSAINDKEKIDLIKNSKYQLYKIYISSIPKKYNEEILQQLSYSPNYSITPNQIIVSKEYLKKYINKHGKDKLGKYANLFLKFIRTFHPEFPSNIYNENFNDVYYKLSKYENDTIYNPESKIFRNNCSSLGCGYLKNNFKSYWNSKYKNYMTPVEMWYDDNIMTKIILYRIGVNTSGEVFNFSIKELIKGISAIRGTISFFKPVLASNIYQHYLADIKKPTVLDPCSGFGGRLLGFKSKYPNGNYIGIEPNIKTFNELNNLGSKFSNIELYNCKFEDFKIIPKYDIIFTSIPYYNLETYNNNVDYKSFDDWVNKFIKPLLSYPRIIINMSYELCEKLKLTQYIDTYIINNTSHFNNLMKSKKEVIIKMNF